MVLEAKQVAVSYNNVTVLSHLEYTHSQTSSGCLKSQIVAIPIIPMYFPTDTHLGERLLYKLETGRKNGNNIEQL